MAYKTFNVKDDRDVTNLKMELRYGSVNYYNYYDDRFISWSHSEE